jgi:hypothetical protein
VEKAQGLAGALDRGSAVPSVPVFSLSLALLDCGSGGRFISAFSLLLALLDLGLRVGFFC